MAHDAAPPSPSARRPTASGAKVHTGTHPMITWLASLGADYPPPPPSTAPWHPGGDVGRTVAARLDDLPRPDWVVLHDVPVGATARLDHLVIGPPGTFTITVRRLTGEVVADGRHVLVDGIATSWLREDAEAADVVGRVLEEATGIAPRTWPVLVLDGCRVRIRERPPAATVLTSTEVPGWFLSQARTVHLTQQDVLSLETATRAEHAWPGAPARATTPTPLRTPRTSVSVTHWPRFGQDRWYVTLADGTTIGHLDATTGTLHVDRPEDESLVRAVLRANYAPLR